ncbi:hypothetical protein BO86DRAFT_385369 [Aspergillus japonicus CBS 114.51]|uniref:Uncharacterized protein n=1 Tax=Aspergillus japonicus CBS 114.51 TaxID=1448312 RepID=A0A8T8XEQ0_ASPJA|nr:hypothetical protein BO86DRAFT_385369 [Aspergillus japonicus CBS 114.51]RAH86521.1 hypothetical protein BO86DRAFT_385369 [Aspergillus japonicus CBS 114.51]
MDQQVVSQESCNSSDSKPSMETKVNKKSFEKFFRVDSRRSREREERKDRVERLRGERGERQSPRRKAMIKERLVREEKEWGWQGRTSPDRRSLDSELTTTSIPTSRVGIEEVRKSN